MAWDKKKDGAREVVIKTMIAIVAFIVKNFIRIFSVPLSAPVQEKSALCPLSAGLQIDGNESRAKGGLLRVKDGLSL